MRALSSWAMVNARISFLEPDVTTISRSAFVFVFLAELLMLCRKEAIRVVQFPQVGSLEAPAKGVVSLAGAGSGNGSGSGPPGRVAVAGG